MKGNLLPLLFVVFQVLKPIHRVSRLETNPLFARLRPTLELWRPP